MNLLDTLTRAADEEQLRLRPLPDHAAATQAEHLRRHYALLLAAVLTAQPTISEPQTRLLRLLLDALKLGDLRGTLFEQARDLTPEPLLEAARLIRDAGFAHHLVLDALVLLRLDAPLGDEAARLAGELAAFCGLDEHQLATRAADAFEILGLDKAENSTDAEDPDAPRPLLLAEIWPNRLRQPLTREALRSGLQGGLWLLDANLDVDFPWQADDALLFFKNGATLNTFAKEGEVKITDCRLVDAVLDFQGACSITIERCDWQGDYDAAEKRTVLNSNGQALAITDSSFSTSNARTIMVQNAKLTMTGSRFIHCGHAELNGGAVLHSDHSREIENCCFDRCVARSGGAIYANEIYGISKCEFTECKSILPNNDGVYDISVYGKAIPNAVINCVFRKTSLRIGEARYGSSVFVRSTQFQEANLYFWNRYSTDKITDNCSFIDGDCVEKKI